MSCEGCTWTCWANWLKKIQKHPHEAKDDYQKYIFPEFFISSMEEIELAIKKLSAKALIEGKKFTNKRGYKIYRDGIDADGILKGSSMEELKTAFSKVEEHKKRIKIYAREKEDREKNRGFCTIKDGHWHL